MTFEWSLTKYLKNQFRIRPKREHHMSFKVWMRETAGAETLSSSLNPNATDAARDWCRRKGVKA